MSKNTGPPGNLPAVRTCIEMDGRRPITFRDREAAADFIIEHFTAIRAVHSAPLRGLPQTADSQPNERTANG